MARTAPPSASEPTTTTLMNRPGRCCMEEANTRGDASSRKLRGPPSSAQHRSGHYAAAGEQPGMRDCMRGNVGEARRGLHGRCTLQGGCA